MKNQEEAIVYFEGEKQEMFVWQILGPLSLLLAFILSTKTAPPYDLYAVSFIGLFLSARWHFRGCFYALLLLVGLGVLQHTLGNVDHFWRLGLEGAILCSFFITALSFENTSFQLDVLHSQLKAKAAALVHSEEDLTRTREEAAQKQMVAAEKLDVLQKDLEDTVAEKGSFEVLNDVLRKVTAGHFEEKKGLEERLAQDKRRLAHANEQIENLHGEVAQLKSSDHEAEKTELLDELNEIRVEKEQTHLINEKLVRLHAKESLKAQVALDQLAAAIESKREIQEQLRGAIQQAETSMANLKKAEKDQTQYQGAVEQIGRFHQEKLFLQERIRCADMELSVLKKTPVELEMIRRERDQLAGQLVKAQEKIYFLSKIEPLHKQLKTQFEEKNKVLQETRAALFHVDTELQTLKSERDQNTHVVPEILSQEFVQLDEKVASLEKENEELQGLVTHFMNQMPPDQRKSSLTKTLDEALHLTKRRRAKVKEQDLLF